MTQHVRAEKACVSRHVCGFCFIVTFCDQAWTLTFCKHALRTYAISFVDIYAALWMIVTSLQIV